MSNDYAVSRELIGQLVDDRSEAGEVLIAKRAHTRMLRIWSAGC